MKLKIRKLPKQTGQWTLKERLRENREFVLVDELRAWLEKEQQRYKDDLDLSKFTKEEAKCIYKNRDFSVVKGRLIQTNKLLAELGGRR